MMLSVLVMITISSAAAAQSTGGSTSGTSAGGSKNSSSTAVKNKSTKKQVLNHRKNYKWKNGQQATPTGNEASPTNGGYVSLKKDTAATVPKKKEK